MKRLCLQCKDRLRGRIDKKFCSDLCRSKYHNRHQRERARYMRQVNQILRANHRILTLLNPEGKTRLPRSQLVAHGFHFGYFTNEYVTRQGKVYRFCYEQGYLELEDGEVALVVKEAYVK